MAFQHISEGETVIVSMRPWILAICVTSGAMAIGSAQAAPVGLSGSDWAKIDRGEIVVTVGAKDGANQLYQVVGTVGGTQAQVYKMLTDFGAHAQIFSKVKSSVIKKRLAADHVQIYKELNLPWPMNGKTVLSDTTLRPAQFGYDWHTIGGNVGTQRGSYETISRNGKSVLVYKIWYDMATAAMPKMVLDKAQQVALPGMIEDLRKAVSRY